MSQAKLWIIHQDHDIRKLDLPHGIPEIVEELESIVRETFNLFGNFSLHYKDADFGEEYFTLSSTRVIYDKDTIKVFHIADPPTLTMTFTNVDCPLDKASETAVSTADDVSVESSQTFICPSTSSRSSGSHDTVILSLPEHQRSQRWPTEFPIPRYAYESELVLAAGN